MAESDRPAEGKPPGDDEEHGAEEEHPPEEPEPEIEDPLESETIKYATEERLLAVTLDGGPKVSDRSMDVFLLAEFLRQLDRVVRGLAAWARDIPLELSGRIPKPEDAAPWRSRGVVFRNSAELEFVLGQPEALRISDEGETSSPTIEAIRNLSRLIRLDAAPVVEQLERVDDRIGRDFTRLMGLLADNELHSEWEPLDQGPVRLQRERADRVRAVLRSESAPVETTVTVIGALFQLKRNTFTIEPDEAEPVTGSFDEGLVDELRGAWRHRVVAELKRIERRYSYATHPHKVDHELKRIAERLEPVD